MSNRNDLLQQADKEYKASIDLIRSMLRKSSSASGQDDGKTLRGALVRFDRILQAVLLHEALSDGVYMDSERDFIEQITKYGDLMELIRERTNGELNMTWKDISVITRPNRKKLLGLCDRWIRETAGDFALTMSQADNSTPRADELEQLTNHIVTICVLFSLADGDEDEKEVIAASRALAELLVNPWQRTL